MEELVSVDNIEKIYRVGSVSLQVLKGVSLQICKGDLYAVIGPSGCGKTT